MEQVPPEIQKIILNYFDDKTRRIARLSCKKWLNSIDYRDFTIYLTKKSEWPQIVDRLTSYSKPISLHFRKNIMNKLEDINEHLLRLTTLTDLTFDDLDKNEVGLEAEWFKLTALPNLHSVSVKNYEYHIPLEALLSMPNLTTFEQPWQSEDTDNMQLLRSMQQWTNLQSCSILQDNELDVDLFGSYNTTLTYLSVYVPSVDEKLFRNLGNLKEVSITSSDVEQQFSLKTFTAIERLNLIEIQLHELTSARLTFLELYNATESYLEKEQHNLTSLKQLVFDLHQDDEYGNQDENEDEEDDRDTQRYSYQWFTTLTALEFLNVDPMENYGLLFISTTLTSLQIAVNRPVDLDHVSRFVSLKQFFLRSKDECLQDLSTLSVLTKLESLQIDVRTGHASEANFLSSMTNLTWLYLSRYSPGEISNLPNLAQLTLCFSTACQFTGFEALPKLTEIEIGINWEVDDDIDFDYTFVSNLPTLRSLIFHPIGKQYDCRYFSTLTDLQRLQIDQVTSEDDYCHLSTLTKLTELKILHGPCSVKILNLPTSLQKLNVGMSQASELFLPAEPSDNVDTSSITPQLVARLPNLYKYSFEYLQ